MIVSLVELREQLTSRTSTPEFGPGDARRLNPLSIEQQKKRAKELLREWRAREASALERFRRHCPSAAGSDSGPRLGDAQLVIAREYGFRKWADLKAHADHIRIARAATRLGRPSALDSGYRTLHIRCGHDIMHKLAVAGFEGGFMWFADPYVEGPVPRTSTLDEFVRVRARYLEEISLEKNGYERLRSSYDDLELAKDYESVNLWLEHDSYDQLILARLLDFFSDASKRPPRLRLITVTHFPGVERFNGIGQLPAEALRVLWNDFRDVDEGQLALGKQAWLAVTSPTPEALLDLVRTQTPALPTMSRALARHLRELPSSGNGLSLTEQLTLQILAAKGAMNAPRLFGWYTNHYEPLTFMGDTGYWNVLRGLADASRPALRIHERGDMPRESNRHWQVELLPFGEDLLRNRADWLKANTVERWVGGVRIDSRDRSNWRFDDARGEVLRD
ncbi:MAG: hypothetical protein JWO70_2260 [Betaproteobacteria bacterium]|jgi:hypothetical protein|nr:hypothetical protein [Betaproteobacteria bacterium]